MTPARSEAHAFAVAAEDRTAEEPDSDLRVAAREAATLYGTGGSPPSRYAPRACRTVCELCLRRGCGGPDRG
ncbi:hypothetical protein QFZ75_000755 [Streptomyces sp. V3I8]|nr:hypothetical protein [Streptomyces sp. V3I8]